MSSTLMCGCAGFLQVWKQSPQTKLSPLDKINPVRSKSFEFMEVFLIHVSPWQTAITIHRFTGKDRHDELNTEQLTRSLSPHLPQCQSTHLTLNTTRRVLSRHTSTQASQTLFSHCRTLIQAPRTSLLPRRSISMPAIVHSKCLRPPIMHPLTPSCHPLRLPQSGDQSLLHPH